MVRLVCAAMCWVLCVAASAQDAQTIHVAQDGVEGAHATIEAAQQAVRTLKGAKPVGQPIEVIIHGGTYFLDAPLTFTAADSGTESAPVTYRAKDGETVILSGGRPITGWTVQDGRWTVELPEAKGGGWIFSALWVNGEYRHVARTPNEGFLATAGKVEGAKDANGAWTDAAYRAFIYAPGDIAAWPGGERARVVAYHSWDTSHFTVQSLDESTRTVTLSGKTAWPYENWGEGQRYYVENFPQALDAPGEWYLDAATGLLTYIPREGETPESTIIIAPKLDRVIAFEGKAGSNQYVEHITLDGLSIRHADHTIGEGGFTNQQAAWSVNGAIHGVGARFCSVRNSEITQCGTYGIWFQTNCENIAIVRNNIHHVGAGGVRIGNMGNDPTAWCVVDNNWIHDLGLVYPAAVGVSIGRSSYNTISHNRIHDGYYTGISIGWSWGYDPSSASHNLIEFNHVHDLGKGVLSDMGGIYLLGRAPGTVVRNNIFHDIESFYYGGSGIYPDEGSSNLLIEDNIAYDTKTGGFHQHYGRENIVRNNIFAFSKNAQVMRSREEPHLSFIFWGNIVYFDNGNLLGSTWKNEHFVMDKNCYFDASGQSFNFSGATLEEWQARGHDKESIIADPLFVDAANRDFTLKPDSPAITQLGFVPIDTTKVGLYGDAEWVAKPAAN